MNLTLSERALLLELLEEKKRQDRNNAKIYKRPEDPNRSMDIGSLIYKIRKEEGRRPVV